MKPLIIACTLLLLSGCAKYIQNRNVARMDSYAVQYPAEEARLANWLYPCFTGKAKSDTIRTEGKRDTIITPGKTVITHVKDTIVKTVTLPGRQVTIPTFLTIHDTVTDQRALSACTTAAKVKSDSLVTVKTQYTTANKKANLYFWILAGIAGVVLVYLGIKTYIFFTGGAVANTAGNILKKL